MTEISSTLSQLRTNFEELEKRIKAIERQGVVSSELGNIKSCLSDILVLLQNYEKLYNQHISGYDSHVEDFLDFKLTTNNHINSCKSWQSNTNVLLGLLDNECIALSDQLASLNDRVAELERGGTGSGDSVQSFEDYHEIKINFTNPSSALALPIVAFYADTTQYVDLQISVYLTAPAEVPRYAPTFYLKYNGEQLETQTFDIPQASQELCYTFNKRTLISKEANTIQLVGSNFADYFVDKYIFHFKGKNMTILSKNQDVKIGCFNNTYYIYDGRHYNNLRYGTMAKDALTLDTSSLTSVGLESKLYQIYCIPAMQRSVTTKIISEASTSTYPLGFFFPTLYMSGNRLTTSKLNSSQTKIMAGGLGAENIINMDTVYYPLSPGNYVLIGADINGNIKYMYHSNTTYNTVSFNSENLTNFYDVALVKQNNVLNGDVAPNEPGFVAWRGDNMNVFYPNILNINYCVEIAPGRNATAYLQQDNSINVYINRGCNVYKYVLKINEETLQYELQNDMEIFKGITKYEELYDGKALVFKMNECEIWE